MRYVLDIGNCDPDHASIKSMIESNIDAAVVRAAKLEDAIDRIAETAFSLILVNRLLDIDGTEGLDVIRALRKEVATKEVPIMMITNFAEHQEIAITEGAIYGFGKKAIGTPETIELVKGALQLEKSQTE